MSISLATKGIIRDAPLLRTVERIDGMTVTLESVDVVEGVVENESAFTGVIGRLDGMVAILEVVDGVEGLVEDKIILTGVIDKPDGDPC